MENKITTVGQLRELLDGLDDSVRLEVYVETPSCSEDGELVVGVSDDRRTVYVTTSFEEYNEEEDEQDGE